MTEIKELERLVDSEYGMREIKRMLFKVTIKMFVGGALFGSIFGFLIGSLVMQCGK